jgi:hypothetical protein
MKTMDRSLSIAFICVILFTAAQLSLGQKTGPDWVNISGPITTKLAEAGTKIPWPGQTAGVCVDSATGRVFMDVTGIGLYVSDDHGDHFTRMAPDQIGGRCEFGYALNADPAGLRLACFMLDGKCGMTLDGGKTWSDFARVGRNWDFGAVDWSDRQARSVFAIHHESGGEAYFSTDAGKSWKFLGKHPEFHAVAVFDDHTLVAGRNDGIVASTDAGATWKKISNLHPVGRVAIPFNGTTYWLAKEGIITSRDHGTTWKLMGTPVGAGWGPLFGADENHLVVANLKEILQSSDGGATWKPLAPLPLFKEMPPKQPGEFLSLAWDAKNHLLYASRMANATYRLELK